MNEEKKLAEEYEDLSCSCPEMPQLDFGTFVLSMSSSALVGELSDMRAQMQTKREALQARVSKEIGIDLPMGFGKHDRRGKGGHGRGHGEFGQRGMGRGMNPGMGQDMVPAPNAAPATPGA